MPLYEGPTGTVSAYGSLARSLDANPDYRRVDTKPADTKPAEQAAEKRTPATPEPVRVVTK